LHTIGGIIGGISGSVRHLDLPPRAIDDPNFPFPFRRDEEEAIADGFPPSVLYWLLVSFLLGIAAAWTFVAGGMRRPEDLFVGLMVGVMILPALQLGASVLACIVIGLFYEDRSAALARIGTITWWSFAGGMIGMVAMGGCCGVFSMVGR
jgi:hypothetical protein